MKIKDLIEKNKVDLPKEISNEILLKETKNWSYYTSIGINASIAIGWLDNDDIFIINCDGEHIYDIVNKKFDYTNYDDNFKKNISKDNLFYYVEKRNVTIPVFGLRGGGGNLLTKDTFWKIDLISLAWNIKIPIIEDKHKNIYFLELQRNFYDDYMYIGFSRSEKYFLIMGDQGIDIFCRK